MTERGGPRWSPLEDKSGEAGTLGTAPPPESGDWPPATTAWGAEGGRTQACAICGSRSRVSCLNESETSHHHRNGSVEILGSQRFKGNDSEAPRETALLDSQRPRQARHRLC